MEKKNEAGKEKIEALTFEEAIRKLEQLVEKMEKEELPLEQSLQCFQEGTEIARHCQKLLNEAENKVKIILQSGERAEFEEADRKDAETDA